MVARRRARITEYCLNIVHQKGTKLFVDRSVGGEGMAITVELRQLGDQSQVRPKPLIRIVLPVLDGFRRDPSVLVVYTVPVYGQSGLGSVARQL
jgi:hypothetical protein